MTMTVPTTAQIAQGLERGARIAAPAIAFVSTCIVLLTELAYALGRLTGEAVYARNEQLAAFWRHLWVPATASTTLLKRQSKDNKKPRGVTSTTGIRKERKQTPLEPGSMKASRSAPAMHPLALLASELQSCTNSELRRITGSRRRCCKAELVAAYVAA